MSDTIVFGKTYQEHLREVRALQFGYEPEVIESIDTLGSVTIPVAEEKPTRKKNKKEKNNE